MKKEDTALKVKRWTLAEKMVAVKLREEKGYGAKKISDATGMPIDQIRFWIYGVRTSKKTDSKKSDKAKNAETSLRQYYRLKYNNWEQWKAQTISSSLRVLSKRHGIDPLPIKEIKAWLNAVSKECYYCQISLNEHNFGIDHAKPVSRGGTNDVSNLVASCKTCNSSKGAMTSIEYKQLLELISKWPDEGKALLARLRYAGTAYKGKKR